MNPLNIAILASGRGSNMQAIVDAFRDGLLKGKIVLLVSNNLRSEAMERARREGIPALHLSSHTHPNMEDLDQSMVRALEDHGANLVCLAGYMKKLGPLILERYRGRLLNIHPSLLPRCGGKGMYGERVHRAVLATGDSQTGATVHLVKGDYDTGPILAQKQVPVLPGDTVDILAARVLEVEHQLYVETLARIQAGDISLVG